MTKLTFDVDFTKDPKEILQEIQERAKAEVAKRESKIKSAAFLSNLHEKVNQEIGTDFKTVNDLIRALTAYANPKLRDKISSTSPSGRRVTISMSPELFEEIKSKLAQPNSNKAAIARETGASVVQVRKVANGGFDAKFASSKDVKASKSVKSDPTQKVQREAPEPAESIENEQSLPELPTIAPPSMGEEIPDIPAPLAPPPAPSLGLPTVPSVPEHADSIEQEEPTPPLPPIAPPSMGEETPEVPAPLAPPPAHSLDLPPTPPSPTAPESGVTDSPSPINTPAPQKPSISLKVKGTKLGIGAKKGKPTLSLKPGKKKPGGLKITRPPMKPPSA